MPGERFPRSALRFIRSMDSGRTWSEPRTVNDGQEFGSHNFHALTAAPDGSLLATWLDARKGKSGVWMSRSSDGGRTWEPNRPIYADPDLPVLPDLRRGRRGWHHLRRLAGDSARRRPRRGGDPLIRRRQDLGGACSRQVGRLGVSGLPPRGPFARGGRQGRRARGLVDRQGGRGRRVLRPLVGRRQALRGAADRDRREGQAGARAARGLGRAGVPGLGRRPRRDAAGTPAALRRRRERFSPEELLSDQGVAASFPVLALYGDSVAVAWSQTTAAEHRRKLASMVDMKDPKAVMPLPRVGQSEILMRTGAI